MTKKIIITPGEFAGVGLEVSLKALSQESYDCAYVVFSSQEYLKKHLEFIPLELTEINHVHQASEPGVYYINSSQQPVDWFVESCRFCSQHPNNSALVTGPLSKASFKDPNILGHTDYLRSLYPKSQIFMAFFGEHYNCLLLNEHIPLASVSSHLSLDLIEQAYHVLEFYFPNSQIGLLGLNPHAGEEGLIGKEELALHKKFIEKYPSVKGPLPADGFFNLNSYKQYDFLIANYHDQGLIPFKLAHGFKAAQASLGLPFVRTSVNHGTSESLYLQNQADPTSMLAAIQLAKKLLDRKK